MRLSSVLPCSLHSEGFLSSSSEIYFIAKMKFAVFFLLCFVALAAAAPQLLTYPGWVAPGLAPLGTRTLVTGPTVVNGWGWGGRYIAPGYVGPAYF